MPGTTENLAFLVNKLPAGATWSVSGIGKAHMPMMLAGLSYSEERDEVVDFTDSYATGVQVVIVKEGSDVTLDNLGEKMIGTQRVPPVTFTPPMITATIMSPPMTTALPLCRL